MIFIEEEPTGEVYKQLIEYACKINDTITFKVPNDSFYEDYTEEEFYTLCKMTNKTKEEIIEGFDNKKLIDEVYLELKDRDNMLWTENVEKSKREMLKDGANNAEIRIVTESIIRVFIENIIYIRAGKSIYNNNFKKLQKNMIESNTSAKIKITNDFYNIYCIKISDKIKDILLQYPGLYSLKFPNLFEDIKFSKNNRCWLGIESHESVCVIYPNNKKEIEHLKEIGLKFEI